MSITDDVRATEPRPSDGRGGGPRDAERAGGDGQFDRTPPQDVAAEQCVLGGMLLSKDAIADVVEILRTGDFYRPNHGVIFDAILDLYGRGEPADPVTLAAAMHDAGNLARVGGAAYLHTLIASVPTAANAAYYAKIVSERAVLRRLIEAGTRIVQLGYGAGRETDELVDLAQQAVYDVTERRISEDFAVLAEMLQPTLDEIEAVGAQGGMMTGVPTGFTDLDRLLNGLHAGQLIIVAGRPGLGKALALDTPLPTPTGWTTMGEVRVGDRLIDANGRPTIVTAATDVMHDRRCYEVEFSDGSVIVADGEHRWLTHTRRTRRAGAPARVYTTNEIIATLRTVTADRRANHSVTNTAPLDLPEQYFLVPPYTLGVWLGNGHQAVARFTTDDPEIVMYVEADGYDVRPTGPRVYTVLVPPPAPLQQRSCVVCGRPFQPRASSVKTCGRSCGGRCRGIPAPVPPQACIDCGTVTKATADGRRCASCHRRFGSVAGLLREVGVLGDKHIPAAYLRGSQTQRRALLAGLMDTDGAVAPSGNLQYTSISRRLAEDVYELVVSLGYRCSITSRKVAGRSADTSTAYTLNFSTADEVFRLGRKRLLHKERRRAVTGTRSGSRFIVDARPVRSVPVRCVQVDNADHLYLAGRSMIPTHNSTAAMDFSRAAAVKHNMASAIFSLEMSKVEIVMRLLAAEARVPLHVLRSGQLSDDDWTKLARRMGEISEAPLFVDDTPNMNLMEIRAKARRLKQRHDLKLIVVDYLQLMSSPKRVESRQQEVAELSRGLKLLAKEVECPVVAVSQLNRGPEQRTDKRPQLSDLRESGSIEQDADVVILLHRDDYYDKESPRAGEADFIVAKHRNGPTDTVTVAAQLHLSRFVDMAI
jgi:replicative DNA helicase